MKDLPSWLSLGRPFLEHVRSLLRIAVDPKMEGHREADVFVDAADKIDALLTAPPDADTLSDQAWADKFARAAWDLFNHDNDIDGTEDHNVDNRKHITTTMLDLLKQYRGAKQSQTAQHVELVEAHKKSQQQNRKDQELIASLKASNQQLEIERDAAIRNRDLHQDLLRQKLIKDGAPLAPPAMFA